MSDDALRRPLPPSVFARLADATRYVITGVSPDTWFGPLQPLAPMAPPEVKGRQFDYPFGANLNYIPRADDGVSFAELRGLADALPLLRAVIETRKDQIAAQSYAVRARARADAPDVSKSIDVVASFLARPDRRHSFADWLRMLVEEMLVIDAATIYPRYARGGGLYSLDIIDGATIKPLIGEDGRAPEPPDPAYQQILKGVPAADFSADELIYLPRNLRSHRLYGLSPVEQIALTVNIALRRDATTLDYYRTGSSPDAFATLPKEWTADQIRSFQDYFDALMSGNLARRRMTKFMPADFKLIETRQPPLKDQYDEWLARIICYAFSVPASAFVSQVNRATSETLRQQATQEGLVPLKAWVKNALDRVIQDCMDEPGLEFVWVGDDAVDPLQQAQTLQILVGAGIKTREEARAELGLGAESGAPGKAPVAKWSYDPDQPRDDNGRWTAGSADEHVGSPARKPRPTDARNQTIYALAGVLIDQRYDDTNGVTHCTYRTPLGTYTIEFQGDPRTCPTRSLRHSESEMTVPMITLTKQAEDSILKACHDPAANVVRQRVGNIPLLLWSNRSYFVSNSGEKTELGSRFYFYWTNKEEIETSKYEIAFLSTNTEIALAPGELFREGSHQIDFRSGKLVLIG